jgi:hypothetical protein
MTTTLDQLVNIWSTCDTVTGPYYFPGDAEVLGRLPDAKPYIDSAKAYEESDSFDNRGDHRIHVGLLPLPYIGHLASAKVLLMMTNPRLGNDNYFAEQRITEYRDAVIRNLHQQNRPDAYPFFALNPGFAWHSGYSYWTAVFRRVLDKLADVHMTRRAALHHLAQGVAVLQLVPYYSLSAPADKVIRKLASVRAIRDYVKSDVLERAKQGKVTVIVMRRRHDWAILEAEGAADYVLDGPRNRRGFMDPSLAETIVKRLGDPR